MIGDVPALAPAPAPRALFFKPQEVVLQEPGPAQPGSAGGRSGEHRQGTIPIVATPDRSGSSVGSAGQHNGPPYAHQEAPQWANLRGTQAGPPPGPPPGSSQWDRVQRDAYNGQGALLV
jgi:hypothetical protein